MKSSKNKVSRNNKTAPDPHKLTDLILLLNPNSQGGNTGKNWADTYNKVKDFLPKAHRIIFTKKANDGIFITRKLLRKGYKNIVAVGGDGTINEIANGFYDIESEGKQTKDYRKFKPVPRLKPINPRAAIYVIPSGSRNVLAKSLDLQHQGTESLMRIRHMKRRKIDVIAATITDRDNPSLTHNRIVLNAAEIGVGAEIIDRSKKVRGKIKSRFVSTMASVVATLPAYNSNECDIVIDKHKKISSKMTMGIVANGRFLGGGFKAAKFQDD